MNLILYLKVFKVLSVADTPINRLRLYPVILVVCYTPGTINRCLEAAGHGPYFALTLATAAGDGLLGAINALCYGYTEHVKEFVARRWCLKKKNQSRVLLQIDGVNVSKPFK